MSVHLLMAISFLVCQQVTCLILKLEESVLQFLLIQNVVSKPERSYEDRNLAQRHDGAATVSSKRNYESYQHLRPKIK